MTATTVATSLRQQLVAIRDLADSMGALVQAEARDFTEEETAWIQALHLRFEEAEKQLDVVTARSSRSAG